MRVSLYLTHYTSFIYFILMYIDLHFPSLHITTDLNTGNYPGSKWSSYCGKWLWMHLLSPCAHLSVYHVHKSGYIGTVITQFPVTPLQTTSAYSIVARHSTTDNLLFFILYLSIFKTNCSVLLQHFSLKLLIHFNQMFIPA